MNCCFIIAKWGTSSDDALLFLIPLALLALIYFGSRTINHFKQKIAERQHFLELMQEQDEYDIPLDELIMI